MTGFGIYTPEGELLATREHVEEVTYAARTLYAGKVGWIERLSDGALIGAPSDLSRLRRRRRAPSEPVLEAPSAAHPAAPGCNASVTPEAPDPPPTPHAGVTAPAEPPPAPRLEEPDTATSSPPAAAPEAEPPRLEAAPEPPPAPPTTEERVLAALSADTWRTRAEVAQLAGLEEEQTGWVLMQLLDAGRVRWMKGRWSLPP